MIVTVNKIMDETVVRWFRSLDAAQNQRHVMSASRHGVRVEVYLHEIPAEAQRTAHGAYETLRRDRNADVTHLATHVNRGPSNGPLVPIEEVE
ncbi:hypothetical protein ACQEVF_25340 [Nonomuraea polychroma]|uniref:hypothetical protein n=1 Tax=Nonomuraea polychroma TaxID=46176 RepID=UPI003D8B00AB